MGMALSIDESIKKYANYILRAHLALESLKSWGFDVEVEDDIELEATYLVKHKNGQIAKIWWNVPYYINFEPFVEQRQTAFSDDYIRDFKAWDKLFTDIESSLKKWVEK